MKNDARVGRHFCVPIHTYWCLPYLWPTSAMYNGITFVHTEYYYMYGYVWVPDPHIEPSSPWSFDPR